MDSILKKILDRINRISRIFSYYRFPEETGNLQPASRKDILLIISLYQSTAIFVD